METAQGVKDKYGRVIGETIPYSGIRKMIGQRMRQSLDWAPQASMSTQADMSGMVELRRRLAEEGHKVSYTDIFIRAVTAAIGRVPIVNATRNEKEIVVFRTVNVGVATKVGNDLVVPVLYDAQDKSVLEIAALSADLIGKAREGRYAEIPLDGATITVNNLGMYDVDVATPILNQPEATLVAIGAIRDRAWVDGKELVVRPVATISVTNDHSIYDGGQVAEFLTALKEILLHPEEL